MSNPILENFDKAETIKDIAERNEIILNYPKHGILDRDNAIQKIKELRIKDIDIAKVTATRLAISSTPNEKRIKKSLGYLSPMEYRRSLGIAV